MPLARALSRPRPLTRLPLCTKPCNALQTGIQIIHFLAMVTTMHFMIVMRNAILSRCCLPAISEDEDAYQLHSERYFSSRTRGDQ